MYFRRNYQFLSNMYPATITIPIQIDKTVIHAEFPSVENAFQALKDIRRYKEFQTITPQYAKKKGRSVTLRPDWETVKLPYMRRLVELKFYQHPELMTQLLSIEEPIQEDNSWNDTYWGVCKNVGENHLGKILMDIREKYRKK